MIPVINARESDIKMKLINRAFAQKSGGNMCPPSQRPMINTETGICLSDCRSLMIELRCADSIRNVNIRD